MLRDITYIFLQHNFMFSLTLVLDLTLCATALAISIFNITFYIAVKLVVTPFLFINRTAIRSSMLATTSSTLNSLEAITTCSS